jgi:hypothetical protein
MPGQPGIPQHAVRCGEIVLCVHKQLRVGRVIHGFNTQDLVPDCRVMLLQVLQQGKFCARRTDDQYFASPCDRLSHRMVVSLVFLRVSAPGTSRFPMQILVPGFRLNAGNGVGVNVELDNVRFEVVNPDNGMFERHRVFS